MKQTSVEMNFETELRISNECTCAIRICFRNIVEIGLKPVLQNIATIIAASLTKNALFGKYEVDFLFVLGNAFSMFVSSILYTAYNVLLQDAITIDIESKGNDTQGIVLHESFDQLLHPVTRSKPYMYNRFITGTLTQVSGGTYGVRFQTTKHATKFIPFSCLNCNDITLNDGSFSVIIQKGQPIPITGLKLQYSVDYKAQREEKAIFAGNCLWLQCINCPKLDIFFS